MVTPFLYSLILSKSGRNNHRRLLKKKLIAKIRLSKKVLLTPVKVILELKLTLMRKMIAGKVLNKMVIKVKIRGNTVWLNKQM